jgi:hypothetical protein
MTYFQKISNSELEINLTKLESHLNEVCFQLCPGYLIWSRTAQLAIIQVRDEILMCTRNELLR